jgi:hypothetical protein
MANTCGIGTQESLKTSQCLDVAPLEYIILFPLVNSSGSQFELATLTKSAIQTAIAQSDPDDRAYPIDTDVDGVENTTGDPVIQTTEKGKNFFVKNGIDSIAFRIDKSNPAWITAINSFRGNKTGIMGFDVNGNFQYYTNKTADKFLPIPLDSNTLNSRLVRGSYEAVSNVQTNVDYQSGYDPSLIVVIDGDTLDFTPDDIVSGDLTPLVPGYRSQLVSASTTQLVVKLVDGFGDNITDFAVGDFTLNNTTTGSAVTLTGAPESPDGTYTLAYSAGVTAARS